MVQTTLAVSIDPRLAEEGARRLGHVFADARRGVESTDRAVREMTDRINHSVLDTGRIFSGTVHDIERGARRLKQAVIEASRSSDFDTVTVH